MIAGAANIETERLIIRPFGLDDIEASYQMNLNPEVSKYTCDGGIVSQKEIERRIKDDVLGDYKKYGFGRWAVELKGGPGFIGFAGLKYIEELKEVDLGYRFMQEYWGNGFATEAARACVSYGRESLKIDRIVAFIFPLNTGSIRVIEKQGFVFAHEVLEDGKIAYKFILNIK